MNQPCAHMCSPSRTSLPHPSPSHPSGSSQCTSPECPVSWMKPGLAFCFTYDNIHVSMLFSQIILHSPSPTESKRLFYTSVSLLLSRIWGHHYHLYKFHQISHSVVSDSLQPHESQHARPPCPSPTPGVHVHRVSDAIQPSHPLLSPSPPPFSCPQSLPASESFPMSQLFT